MSEVSATGYRRNLLWNFGFSAYWFAVSWKWFILLLIVIPGQVADIVPGGSKNSQWGLVFGIGAIWAMFGPAIFGTLSDRLTAKWGHRRPFIAIGAGLTCIALAFLAGAHSLWMMIVGYLLLQVSDDVGTGPYSALVAEAVPESDRGRASSVMSGLQLLAQIGSAITALILGEVMLIYIGIALVNIICAAVTVATMRGITVAPTAPASEPFWTMWREPFRNADFRWVWFTRFLNAFGFYLISNYLLFYLTDAFDSYKIFSFDLGTPGQTAQILALTISLSGALGSMVSARLSDRLGRKPLIYVAGVLIATALVPFAFLQQLTLTWVLALVFGFGYGIYLSADWALVSDVLPNKDRAGTEMGVWQSSVASVQIFAGMAGTAIDALNRQNPGAFQGYTAAILASAVLFFLSSILVRQVRGSR